MHRKLLLASVSVLLLSLALPHPVQAIRVTSNVCSASVTLVGHRGTDVGVTRNNTIAAFKKAVADGAEVIELDVHRTKPDASGSGTWVINHDPTIDGYVIANTPYATLKKVRPDLATIREAMGYVSTARTNNANTGAPIQLEMEIKPTSVGNGSLSYFASLAREYGLQSRLTITSFQSSVLKQYIGLKTGVGTTGYLSSTMPNSPSGVRAYASSIGLRSDAVTASNVSKLKAAGLKVEVYTIDTEADWSKYVGYGVDGVITNRSANYVKWCNGLQT